VQSSTENDVVSRAFIAFGANLAGEAGPPEDAVPAAMAALARRTDTRMTASRLFRTPAFPPGAGPDFVNAAVSMSWGGTAEALLAVLHEVEAAFGRTRTARWEARLMDLDLIALGRTVVPDMATQAHWSALLPERAAQETPDRLILPHPRMAERSFVLAPLADVAPGWRHPVSGRSVAEMLAARPAGERGAIRPMGMPAGFDPPA
jgi:2-amino-4-hydroxy-6-hydroxymethyldihydropteridine diphosphokinase